MSIHYQPKGLYTVLYILCLYKRHNKANEETKMKTTTYKATIGQINFGEIAELAAAKTHREVEIILTKANERIEKEVA